MNTTVTVEALGPVPTYLRFERLDPAQNAYRYYNLGWRPILFHAHDRGTNAGCNICLMTAGRGCSMLESFRSN